LLNTAEGVILQTWPKRPGAATNAFSVWTARQEPKQNGGKTKRETTKTSTKPKTKLGFRIPTQLES